MNIKKNTEILEISHDELVNLFSTGLYGNTWLSAEYNKEFYDGLDPKLKQGDCFEDKLADTLLNGGEIYLYDNDSEGEIYNDRSNAEVINEDNGVEYTQYTLTLVDVIDGLQKAANGTYKVQNDKKWVTQCFESFNDEDSYYFDLEMADTLLQIIMFDELVYG
jgi:hypothetical protein